MSKYPVAIFTAAMALVACGGDGGPIPVVNPPPTPPAPTITTAPVFANLSFNQGLAMKQAPGDATRWFVVEKGGMVRVFANDPDVLSSSVFLDIRGRVNAAGEGGLLGIAFHPNFPAPAYVYASYTRNGSPLVSYVSRFSSTDGGLTLNAASEVPILTVSQPDTNHNGGDIAFGPDGYLYVGFGDGGGSGDPAGNGQNVTNIMGAMVRIDVIGGSPYAIPPGNPFETNGVCPTGIGSSACPEIFAWGLRNPWRFSFDQTTQNLWAGDVGQGSWEEIDIIRAGGNYGWNVREGAHCFQPATGCATSFIDPVTEYGRGLGQSVTGGYVYRGSAIPDLVGWYLFGDFVSGRLFGVPADSTAGIAPTVFAETGLQIVSFGAANNGDLFLLHFGGSIHQIVDLP